jgi:peptide/nickel transport system substrate-binding protein
MLAGTLDLTLGSLVKVEEGAVLKQEWEARGEGKVLTTPDQVRIADFQFRDPRKPAARDARVRQALAHAVDRSLMTETLHFGLTLPAQYFIGPGEPGYAQADRTVRKYLYDPNRAGQLLEEAGWTRGGDGVLRSAGGERFTFEIQSLDTTQYVKEAQVLGEFWKAVGVDVQFDLYPRARNNDLEYRASYQGVTIGSPAARPETVNRWRSDSVASEASRWRGENRGNYLRPEVDRLSDAFFATLETRQRQDTMIQLLQLLAEDLPSMPLYYPVRVFAVRSGLVGAQPSGPGEGWTVFNAHGIYWER